MAQKHTAELTAEKILECVGTLELDRIQNADGFQAFPPAIKDLLMQLILYQYNKINHKEKDDVFAKRIIKQIRELVT